MRAYSRGDGACLAAATAIAIAIPVVVIAMPTQAQAASTSVTNETAVPAARVAAAKPARPAKPALTKAQVRHLKAVSMRSKLVAFAKKKRYTAHYVYGGYSDNAFDCSGFTKLIYKRVAHINLPHYSVSQWNRTKKVSKRHLLPGDLLFWGPGGSQHVSMYIGHGRMIGANNPRRGVVIESMYSSYWTPRYAGAGRLIQG